MNSLFRNPSNRQSGFSLVELMVAVVIGLIGTLVMFQVFAVSEGQKRTTASGGDAQQNGAIGLFTLERELRNSGHGLADLIALGEPIFGWGVPTNSARPTIVLKPVLITPGDGANGDVGSDLIEINYSNFEGIGIAVPLGTDWNPNSTSIEITNPAAYREGDVLVVCNKTPSAGNPPCIQVQITQPLDGTTTIGIMPPPDTYTRNGYSKESEYNPAGGVGAKLAPVVTGMGKTMPALYLLSDGTTSDDSVAFNLGSGITSHLYRVQNGRLMYLDGTWQEFADGIVSIRAQYGLDTSAIADGSVDAWVDPRGAQPNPLASFTPNHAMFDITSNATIARSWSRVIAIRLAIVARSGIKEKTAVETRSTIPLWANPTGNPVAGPSYTVPSGDGQYYRYRVFETIVPFRNMLWKPT